jgi:hypothetical protein
MNGLYDILESYRQQNDPRFIYEGLYEQPAYTGPNIDPMYNLGARQFGNMNRMDFGVPQQATGIMQQAPLQNLGIDTSYGVANEEDVEQEFLPDQEPSGIAKLFEFLKNIPTPMNLARRGLEALRGSEALSDFRNARTGADFFKARRDREALARDPNVFRDARNITSNLRRTAADNVIDRGRGQSPTRSAPTRSAAATRSRDLGSMRGGVGR